jgi:hypothetical protein
MLAGPHEGLASATRQLTLPAARASIPWIPPEEDFMDDWMSRHRPARLAGPMFLTFLAGCAQLLGIDELHSGAPDAAVAPDAMLGDVTGFGLSGSFTDGLLLGDAMLQSAGSEDVFLARITTGGDVLRAVSAGGIGSDGFTQAVSARNLIVTGTFTDRIQFPGGPELTSRGDTDVFVAKLAPGGTRLVAGFRRPGRRPATPDRSRTG